jgi:hypothetical protein
MKKIILVAAMFHVATSSAIVGRTLATMFSPIIATGSCYGIQACIDRQAAKKKWNHINETSSSADQLEREVEIGNALNPARDFAEHVGIGFAPGLNILMLTGHKPPYGPDIKHMNANEKVGFFAGFSTLTTVIMMMSLLNKLPK